MSYLQFIAPGLVAASIMTAAAYEAAWNIKAPVSNNDITTAQLRHNGDT